MWKYNDMNELYHWGILGMHWGVKRSRSPKKHVSEDHAAVRQLTKKKMYELSNKDLQVYNNRKNLEKNYRFFRPRTMAIGLAAVGTAVTLLSNYGNIKRGIPELITDGKALITTMRHLKIPRIK